MERGWSMRRKEELMQQRSDETRGGIVCDKCGMSFDTKEELDRHVEETHAAEQERPSS